MAQIWFLLGVYHTNEHLYKMGKSKISICSKCQCGHSVTHIILHCQEFSQIRQLLVSDLSELNANIKKNLDNSKISIVTQSLHLSLLKYPRGGQIFQRFINFVETSAGISTRKKKSLKLMRTTANP